MLSLSKLARALRSLFTDSAERAARSSGFVRRRRALTGPAFVQALVFGWLQKPDATLEELAAACAASGSPVSAQALHQRFTPAAADCLLAVLRDALGLLLAARPAPAGLLARFPGGVHVFDSTTVPLPDEAAARWAGCGGKGPAAALKVFAHWELNGGALRLELKPGRQADGARDLPDDLPAGSLRLADLGYFGLDALARDHLRGVTWVSRVEASAAVSGPAGAGSVTEYLGRAGGDFIDHAVALGAGSRAVPCRLLAWRLPPDRAEERRAKARRRSAKRRGREPGAASLALCSWAVLVTNAPPGRLSAGDAAALYRARWQIELLFKRWKSGLGGLESSRSSRPARRECEVYAKLLGALVRHWGTLLAGGWRPARSAHKAERRVARAAGVIQAAVRGVRALGRALAWLRRSLENVGRVARRRKRPATHQTLETTPSTA